MIILKKLGLPWFVTFGITAGSSLRPDRLPRINGLRGPSRDIAYVSVCRGMPRLMSAWTEIPHRAATSFILKKRCGLDSGIARPFGCWPRSFAPAHTGLPGPLSSAFNHGQMAAIEHRAPSIPVMTNAAPAMVRN